MDNTNWSSPKKTFLKGALDLRKALASGYNAKLIRAWNNECTHPILKPLSKKVDSNFDFRQYDFSHGVMRSVDDIKKDISMSEIDKHLTLNYKTCYGTKEAVNTYYTKGKLTMDNLKGMGVSHLVKIDDLIKLLKGQDDVNLKQRAEMYRVEYRSDMGTSISHMVDLFSLKSNDSSSRVITFKSKVWVVVILDKVGDVKIPWYVKTLNVLMYPLKFIPEHSVLRMEEYNIHTLRVGSITHGVSIDLQTPKKFSFK